MLTASIGSQLTASLQSTDTVFGSLMLTSFAAVSVYSVCTGQIRRMIFAVERHSLRKPYADSQHW